MSLSRRWLQKRPDRRSVGHVLAVGREHDDVDKRIGMIVVGEKRTEYAVDKTRAVRIS